MKQYQTTVIGGGPAGLASAIAAEKHGIKVQLIERESRLGGILKQCIHDGFGLRHFQEALSGPEYAYRFIEEIEKTSVEIKCNHFVSEIVRKQDGFELTIVGPKGVEICFSKTLVFATGCRERTAKQIQIHGERPSGIFTAGCAQYFMNILGELPTKRCVILGSGDIGLIMARRLTLEGAKVIGVYEAKSTPSGLTRNIMQCLNDYDIPLYLSHTVTKVFGKARLEKVEISKVDEHMQPIEGSQQLIECDGLIVSVGLIPENELAKSIGITIDPRTKGPDCNQMFMTNVPGCFVCGNALHVNDLVDFVSECGALAGEASATYQPSESQDTPVSISKDFLYFLPQRISLPNPLDTFTFYFRSQRPMKKAIFQLWCNDEIIYEKKLSNVKPPELEHIELSKQIVFKLQPKQYKVELLEVEL